MSSLSPSSLIHFNFFMYHAPFGRRRSWLSMISYVLQVYLYFFPYYRAYSLFSHSITRASSLVNSLFTSSLIYVVSIQNVCNHGSHNFLFFQLLVSSFFFSFGYHTFTQTYQIDLQLLSSVLLAFSMPSECHTLQHSFLVMYKFHLF